MVVTFAAKIWIFLKISIHKKREFQRYKGQTRTILSIEFYGIILVPNPKQGENRTYVSPVGTKFGNDKTSTNTDAIESLNTPKLQST